MTKYFLLIALAAAELPAMQRPQVPSLPLTPENLAILNQSNNAQDVIPMDTSSDTSSDSTQPPHLDDDPVEENALLAQLAALDEHTWATH